MSLLDHVANWIETNPVFHKTSIRTECSPPRPNIKEMDPNSWTSQAERYQARSHWGVFRTDVASAWNGIVTAAVWKSRVDLFGLLCQLLSAHWMVTWYVHQVAANSASLLAQVLQGVGCKAAMKMAGRSCPTQWLG